MKFPLSLLFSLIFFLSTDAQTNKDSLLQIIKNDKKDSTTVSALNSLSRQYWREDNHNLALFYSNNALALNEELSIEKNITDVRYDLEKTSHSMNAHSNATSDSTVKIGTKTTSAREKEDIPMRSQLKILSQRLTEIEAQQKNLDASLRDYKLQTSSFADASVAQELHKNENLSIQQKAITQHLKDVEEKRNWIIGGGIVVLILLSVIFFQIYRRRQTKLRLEINQLNNKVLRSQLNPHFIFNALNSVKKIIMQQPDVAGSYLTKFSTLMRQVLENSREEKISLTEEIAMLENYMELESLRMHNGFDYEISIDQSVDAPNTLIPPLIFQPSLENAIWHGIGPLERKGKIKLSFTEENDLLKALIEDDGVGLSSVKEEKATSEKKRSLGLQITRERIGLLNRKSKSKGFFFQQLLANGSQVRMGIPI